VSSKSTNAPTASIVATFRRSAAPLDETSGRKMPIWPSVAAPASAAIPAKTQSTARAGSAPHAEAVPPAASAHGRNTDTTSAAPAAPTTPRSDPSDLRSMIPLHPVDAITLL